VFSDSEQARQAVRDLRNAGFSDDQIGVVGRDTRGIKGSEAESTDSYAGEGAATGVAAGAGLGALWGVGILAGVMPVIGPAIAAGSLAAVLSSAAAGAAAAGLAGALVGMGIPKEDAEYYESEFKAGRTIVTVTAPGRESEARTIFQRYGAYDRSSAAMTGSTTGSACHVGSTHESSSQKATSASTSHAGESALRGSTQHSSAASHTTGAQAFAGNAGSGGTCATSGGKQSIQAVEEQLHVEKKPVQSEVNVRKEVHTEHKTIDVPVSREEVVIERHAPSGRTAAASDIKSQEIRIPVTEEEVRVEKTPVVKEEVSVGKRKVQGTEHVSEELRKEEIKVDTQGKTTVRDQRTKK